MSAQIIPLGTLRHRLTHQTSVDVPDGAGGNARHFITVDRIWGRVEAVSADFAIAEERPKARHLVRITVRGPTAITPGDRLLWGARLFHVEAVSSADGWGRFSRCQCREEQT
ncbi:head-tail adaptor protein [Xanthobacter sp. TB0139]|uniref:head-tail adaptor protein n=1 Tax=Xanthobacter sp. TB0139 TaxID=3459178 RepID=UPI004039C599